MDSIPFSEGQLCSSRTLLRAWVLLLLHDRPGHGYELIARLDELGLCGAPGRVYRALRWLADFGLVEPAWETTAAGPARRIYTLAPSGRHALDVLAPALRHQAKSLEPRVARHVISRLRGLATGMSVFELTVSTRLSVHARDAASARRKLERIFGQPRVLDVGVRSTGEAYIGPERTATSPGL